MKHRLGGLALGLLALCAPGVVHADEPDTQVARVSYTGGDVSYQRGDSDGWNAIGVNTPLVTGDSLYTADDGRAEVYLGGGNVMRMDTGTQVDLVSNTRDMSQLGLRSGYLNLRSRSAAGGAAVEVDTPNGAATVLDPGVYRFEMSDGTARYSVVKGRLSVALSGQQLDVDAGETLTIEGTDDPRYSFGPIAAQSSLDKWAHDRDIRTDRSGSARYVHRDVVGYEDLDDNGTWHDTSEYGRVWTPAGVSAGWAPYQAGQWTWQDPYGWTWVSSEPWGWAPYHYGRWVNVSGSWGWVPPPPMGYRGPAVVADLRPVYAPALVAFIGGKNWSVGVSLGGGPSVGWVPLAPAEHYYYPWQPAPHVTNNYTYTNITVVNAVTVVNQNNFSQGPIRPIHVPPGQLKHAPRMGYTATEIVPTHQSLCPFEARDPHSRYVPRHEAERPLIVRTAPPPKPVPFHDKVVEIQRTGRPFDDHDRGRHEGWAKQADRNDRNVASDPHVGDDRNYRLATVATNAPGGHGTLMPRPGATAKPPKSIEQDAPPQNAHRHRDDEGMNPVARSEPGHGPREYDQPNGPSHPEHGAVQAPPAGHDERQARYDDHRTQSDDRPTPGQPRQANNNDPHTRNDKHHAAPPSKKNDVPAPDPRPIATNAPPTEPEPSHGRATQTPADETQRSHAHTTEPPREARSNTSTPSTPAPSASMPSAPRPTAPAPAVQENHARPQNEGGKSEAPKAKGKDDKSKDKDKDKSGHDGKSQGN